MRASRAKRQGARPPRLAFDPLSKAAVALGFGLVLSLLEPFGFAEDAFVYRFGFWTVMMILWSVLFSLAEAVVARAAMERLGPVSMAALAFGLVLLPMTLASQRVSDGTFGWPSMGDAVERLFQVALIGGAFELVFRTVAGRLREGWRRIGLTRPDAQDSPAPTPPAASLAARLPFSLQGPIVCLKMEDHYVRVHTTRGSTLLLMRFSDALAELDPASGLRVHRSWWIASDALVGIERSSRATRVRLTNGVTAPVSQPYLRALTELALRRNLAAPIRPALLATG